VRSALVALWALGCAGDKAADSAHEHGTGEDSGGGGLLPLEQQAWANPGEAEDLAPEAGVYRVQLRAAPYSFELLDWQGGQRIPVEGLAYNNQVPGPTLRVQVGDVVEVELVNAIEEWTTIHWHGIELDNAMDGVPELQDPVNPGDSFTYRFTATRAGTYWYHPHFNVMEQVSAGLFGALIVEDPADPPADRELVGILHDWGGTTVGEEHIHGAHGDEGLWTINSQVVPALALSGGERLRMRLINASGAGYVRLSGEVLGEEVEGAELIATDQGLLAAAEPLSELLLTPGDRGELLLRPGEQAPTLLDWPWSVFGGEAHGDPVALYSTSLAAPAPPVRPWICPSTEAVSPKTPATPTLLTCFRAIRIRTPG
jgi:FtsP/CotA-like multicopper oxidase with cupredoxin domain